MKKFILTLSLLLLASGCAHTTLVSGISNVKLFDPSIEDIYKIGFEEWNPIKSHGLFYSKFDMNGYNTISIWWDGIVLINGESIGLDRRDVAAITHLYGYITYIKFED